jgi:hypothetical protein
MPASSHEPKRRIAVGSAVKVANMDGGKEFCSGGRSRWGNGRRGFRKGKPYYFIMVFIFNIAEISTLLP